ncbi:P-loop containing nucleoside triphosphate hydrolase protein [Hyaloscypha bicolor E]|uniref:P-loop containing nucleoside triphosphate hydrolase protein n=1 Tax=Hyaloscypha bicolor E TaxID=1095630 RepID=A0A2J6TAI8_9HELO|nr:P-loop containing nucleoside triphosphate hydrolase protein [Hyaloscypha bicolor E]PMD60046.1 P-loop containing nucleoside triphosphate hydrolase protein [Hyaloscypha bicolor E]
MGVTGAGKSSFIRRVTGNDGVLIGSGLQSMTQEVQSYKFEHDGKVYSIVDTPGFNDTYRSDNEVLKELADWLLKSYQDGVKINGIIYLHRISDTKMEGSALRNLRMFRKLCGEDFMKNVILGTTFWDIVGVDQGVARETELLRTESFFKVMQEQGSTVERILDDRESNLALLSRFAAKQPHVMRIQQELFEGKTLSETAAASAVSRELAELQHQNLEKLSDVEVQAQKKITRSSLEKVLTLHLERKTFDSTIHDLSAQQEEIREEQMEEDKKNDERMTKLQEEKHCQDQRFQVQLNDLNEKLRAIKASPGKRG